MGGIELKNILVENVGLGKPPALMMVKRMLEFDRNCFGVLQRQAWLDCSSLHSPLQAP
jgi:hypothetical protein